MILKGNVVLDDHEMVEWRHQSPSTLFARTYRRITLEVDSGEEEAKMQAAPWMSVQDWHIVLGYYNWDRSFIFFVITNRGAILGRVPRVDLTTMNEASRDRRDQTFREVFEHQYLRLYMMRMLRLKDGGDITVSRLEVWAEKNDEGAIYAEEIVHNMKASIKHGMTSTNMENCKLSWKEDIEVNDHFFGESDEIGAPPPPKGKRDHLSARMACAVSYTVNRGAKPFEAAVQTWFGTEALSALQCQRSSENAVNPNGGERLCGVPPSITRNMVGVEGTNDWAMMEGDRYNPFEVDVGTRRRTLLWVFDK